MTRWLLRWLWMQFDHSSSGWRLLAFVLLLAALSSVARGLVSVVRGLEAGLLLPIAILGALVGWRLAVSTWSGWLAGPASLAAGIAILMSYVGGLGEALATVPWLLLSLAWEAMPWQASGPPDGTPLLLVLNQLGAGIKVLLNRLVDWLLGVALGEPAFDPVAVALVWGLALWAAAAWGGWAVRRRDQPLLGLLPAGTILVVSMAYSGGNFAFLLVLVGLTWLLTAMSGQAVRERRWQAAGIDFALDIRTELAVVTIWLAVGLVALAQLAPVISAQQAAQLAQRLIWGQPIEAGPVARSLGLQPQPRLPTAFDRVRAGGLPRQHLLGSGPELSEQVVMLVDPGTTSLKPKPPTYYWRSLTYDRYTGHGWSTGRTETVAYGPGVQVEETLEGLEPSNVLRLQQQIQTVDQGSGLLHVAGLLVTVDQPYQVAWRTSGDAFGATVEAATYQVNSLSPVVDEAQLRLAGNRYPSWVQRRYLALPDAVPARVLALARELTALQPTPYDRAQAIETYLRTFPYDLNLPTPPPGRDVVDYFLFDLRRGYCDYYATAMVILARAAGIPARLVVGYAGGVFEPANHRYLVTEADAHAWPELYFPGSGWIEFEPTAARPLLAHPEEPVLPAALEPETSQPELTTAPASSSQLWWLALPAGVAVLVVVGAAWTMVDAWRLRHMPSAATLEQLYGRLQSYGPKLAVSAHAGDTPYEFSHNLAACISELALTGRWTTLLAVAPEIKRLTELYIQAAYSSHPPTPADQNQAIQIWQWLRWRLWLAYLRHVLTVSTRRFPLRPR